MKNIYNIVVISLAIAFVTIITINIKDIIDKSASNSTSRDSIVSEGDSNMSNKFIEDGEMRGVWLSTVNNLDWPEISSYNNKKVQKELLREKLDFVEEQNMNTVFFQVRAMGDALYNSSYAPWSKYLTGTLGKDPGYNPLNFAIEEAHKRGLELQAWFNPFRIDSNADTFNKEDYLNALPKNSILKNNPNWIVKYDKYHYLDIGIPEVREYVINLILEVVNNYNIDGVHLDDYFYPYPVSGLDFPDDESYERYGSGFSTKEDWRRNNVNNFISELNSKIKEAKSSVKFGVSPFGIWRNGESLGGSETRGISSYDDIYVDSKKWIEEGWLDYIVPQIYWQSDHSTAPYKTLVDWWSRQVEGTDVQLYIGHAVYKINDSNYGDSWLNGDEVLNQVTYAKANANVKGSCFFRVKSLEENRLGFTDKLRELYSRGTTN